MIRSLLLGVFAAASLGAGSVPAETLEAVRERGKVSCGINSRLVGFSAPDSSDNWQGFDVAICRAVAAAVLSDAAAVEFHVAGTDAEGMDLLTDGKIDILSRNIAWTFGRDVGQDVTFVGVSYYDGQGVMVPKSLGIASARELDEATVCIPGGAGSQANMARLFAANNTGFQPVPVDSDETAVQKYLAGECEAYTNDASALAATRATFEDPAAHVILPELVSKEPLGPVVRHGDDDWADIVRWTLNALIAAEEYGVTSANIDELAANPTSTPEINRLLGTEGDLGAMLGLQADWAVRAIKAGGNYGELFEKYIGQKTPVGLARGLNAQWTNGGLLYALPFR
ncbi:amino acid ABC transporter substrate-binding protein [Rhodovulum tesquicola]|uniref:amino acid ABC transporter substrate-binding protein n=1 Tax=Rhodovulum tesquicola TaxID=540254 RepID=UPI0020972420|nr:amino acid ABC transporter substrate-binding protein [Rhodovulum tesquicola]MCO8145823.1 amino acid ABC transporter substrate-binding protein [Rhodovulum tesquicola]